MVRKTSCVHERGRPFIETRQLNFLTKLPEPRSSRQYVVSKTGCGSADSIRSTCRRELGVFLFPGLQRQPLSNRALVKSGRGDPLDVFKTTLQPQLGRTRSIAIEACDGLHDSSLAASTHRLSSSSTTQLLLPSIPQTSRDLACSTRSQYQSQNRYRKSTQLPEQPMSSMRLVSLEDQNELRKQLSDVAARTLFFFGLPHEAHKFAEPSTELPRNCQFSHLHGLNNINTLSSSGATEDDITETSRILTSEDKALVEMLRKAHSAIIAPQSIDVRQQSLERDADKPDEAPRDLDWHYILEKDALDCVVAAEKAQKSRSPTMMVASSKPPRKEGPSVGTRSLVPVPPTHNEKCVFTRSSTQLPTSLRVSKGDAPKPSQQVSPLTDGTTARATALFQEGDSLGLGGGEISLAEVANRAGMIAEHEAALLDQARIHSRRMLLKAQMQKQLAADVGDHGIVADSRREDRRASQTLLDSEGLANRILHNLDPHLFDETGVDTDPVQFPKFPFGENAEMSFYDAPQELAVDEKQWRKYECGLITRQLQRNRKLVDEQDNPALDRKSWKQAVSGEMRSQRPATPSEVYDKMLFVWRSAREKLGADVPCFIANSLEQRHPRKGQKILSRAHTHK